MARDLRLTAVLVDKVSSGLAKAGADWKKAIEEPALKAVKVREDANKKIIASDERVERERIRLQIASAKLADKQNAKAEAEWKRHSAKAIADSMKSSENTLSISKNAAAASLKIQRQAALAESALVLNKFDRMIAKEKQVHAFRLADLKGNDAAIEAEYRRHNAVIGRMSMDKANFPNTPFQRLLGGIGNLSSKAGIQTPAIVNTASSTMAAGGVSAATAVGFAAAGAAAIAFGAALKYSYGEARESIDAEKKLDLVLRSTGRGAQFSADSLKAMANTMQMNTDFTDEAVMSAETILLRFDNIGKNIFPAALRATADLGAETGDLSGAAEALGQALQQPEDAGRKLRAMSIILTDTQKKMLEQFVETGDRAKAQQFILDAVAKSYGGNAETMSHANVKLGHAFGELAETIGKPFVSAVDIASNAILKLIKTQDPDAPKRYYTALANGQIVQRNATEAEAKAEATKRKAIDDTRAAEAKAGAEATNAKAKQEAEEKLAVEAGEKAKQDKKDAIEESKRLQKEADAEAIRLAQEGAKRKGDAVIKEDRRLREAKAMENEMADQADEARHQQRKSAKTDLSMEQASEDPLAQLKLKQSQELALVTDNQAKLDLIETHKLQVKRQTIEDEKKLQAQKFTAASTLAQGLTALAAQSNMKDKGDRLRWKTMAITEAGINTARGVMQVIGDRAIPSLLKIPMAVGIGAMGLAQVNSIKEQSFASGTDFAPGGRALVGERGPEYVDLPRGSKVHTASQSKNMGGNTIHAPISITITGNADDRTVKAIGETIEQKLKHHAWMTKQVEYRGITA